MPEGYMLGREALRQIQALIRTETLRAVRRIDRPRSAGPQPLAVYLAESPAGGIPAMSGTTPGSATCTVKYIDEDGEIQTKTNSQDDDVEIEVYNVASSAVAGSTVVQCKQEIVSGKYLCDFEDCG